MNLKKIKVENSEMILEWNDDSISRIKLSDLRRECPCAYCANERENDHGKFEVYTTDQITVKEVILVGTYALNIVWNDNHKTGFYEFSLLKNLSEIIQ